MIQHGASLQRLSLAGCGAWVTDEELQIVTQYCSNSLVCLDLCGCAQLSDWSISNCLHKSQSLTTVSLAMMGQLSSEALAHYAPRETAETNHLVVPLPHALERLDLTGCGGIGWFGLEAALRGIGAGLLELSLRGQVAMPADGIVNVLRRCPNLEQLDASCCLSIDDSAVAEICSICPELRTLALSACPAVAMPNATGKYLASPRFQWFTGLYTELNVCDVMLVIIAVAIVGARCRKLKTLSLAGCLDVCPHDGLPALLSRIPQLERLDLAHCTQFHPVSHSTGHLSWLLFLHWIIQTEYAECKVCYSCFLAQVHVMSALHDISVLTARTKANGHAAVTLALHIPPSAVRASMDRLLCISSAMLQELADTRQHSCGKH